MSETPEKPTVRAGRRRTDSQPSSTERRRAETPQRRQTGDGDSGGSPPTRPASSGGLGFPGGSRGKPTFLGFVIMLLVACVYIAYLLLGGGGPDESPTTQSQDNPLVNQAPLQESEGVENDAAIIPTRTARPTKTPAVTGNMASRGGTWTVMLYQDADDKVLEQDIYVDLNEAERSGSTDRLNIIAQFDRHQGAFQGDGNWTSTRRYYVTKDDNLNRLGSQLLADLGEANMADPDTLVEFVTWSMKNYPADRYALILSDHGLGWPGGWSDPAPGGSGDPSIPLSASLGNHLYLHQLDQALEEIRQETGVDKLDLVGLDACLMGQLEVFTALAPHAHYAVASQEVEPALGWAYTGFLDELVRNPGMDGAALSKYIVDSYIDDDQRIQDEQARSEMLRQGSVGGIFGLFGQPSAEQVARQLGEASTLTAVNLDELPAFNVVFNELIYLLQTEEQSLLAKSRAYAQSFTNIFGSQVPPSYIDLGSFLEIISRETRNSALRSAVTELNSQLDQVILLEKHGEKKPGATGLTFYFPNSKLYQSPLTGARSYHLIASRFSEESLWDDFLAYHYTNQTFDQLPGQPTTLQSNMSVKGPGAGNIKITDFQLSDDSVSPGEVILLSADIGGNNIGHIYLFVGFYDETANSIYLADMDYLESDPTREVNGIFYPTWSESSDFLLGFEWEPIVFNITDGTNSYTVYLKPTSYGATAKDAVYTVDGIYTFVDGKDRVSASLLFSDGALRQVLAFTGNEQTGAPHEIIPQQGDTFTILETWLDLDSAGNVSQQAQQPGGTLVFGDQTFSWEELTAASGEYVVGFVVEDLDFNTVQSYGVVKVR